ncbi:Cobyrinic acid ac-diamide synthase [Haliangium ochraceum DSM 14365]|uniref:Cobyrinic acid ac-diamide synthase n=1 Tax=Haliangium ochraceum (strain DSM 14365 / JCM 11303 / SMP-2) TaxID=502025 RepID=D0LUG3_HALO1|nr:Cobyrinic acid ac-diamide synthase [Haliangium ochraceum DSM 14365]
MKSLVIASPKGGVGKTTVSLHLSYALAGKGYRVLLLDTDPQGAIGLSLSKKLNARPGFHEYVRGGNALADVRIETKVPNFHLVPVGQLTPIDTELFSSALSTGDHFRRIAAEAENDGYDILVIDSPCGFSGITMGALRTATHVLSPIQAEPIALRAVTQLLELVAALREQNCSIQVAGFLVTMLQLRQNESYGVAQEVWERFPERLVFDAHVPRDPVFLEATAAGVPVALLRRPPPPVTHVFDLVAAELESRLGLAQPRETDGPQPFLD